MTARPAPISWLSLLERFDRKRAASRNASFRYFLARHLPEALTQDGTNPLQGYLLQPGLELQHISFDLQHIEANLLHVLEIVLRVEEREPDVGLWKLRIKRDMLQILG